MLESFIRSANEKTLRGMTKTAVLINIKSKKCNLYKRSSAAENY